MGPLTFSKDGGSWRCPRRPRTTGIPERELRDRELSVHSAEEESAPWEADSSRVTCC